MWCLQSINAENQRVCDEILAEKKEKENEYTPAKDRLPGMKLFVWHGVLWDHTSGIAFALAKTVWQAKKAILDKDDDTKRHWEGIALDGVMPKVYTESSGFAIFGGG